MRGSERWWCSGGGGGGRRQHRRVQGARRAGRRHHTTRNWAAWMWCAAGSSRRVNAHLPGQGGIGVPGCERTTRISSISRRAELHLEAVGACLEGAEEVEEGGGARRVGRAVGERAVVVVVLQGGGWGGGEQRGEGRGVRERPKGKRGAREPD